MQVFSHATITKEVLLSISSKKVRKIRSDRPDFTQQFLMIFIQATLVGLLRSKCALLSLASSIPRFDWLKDLPGTHQIENSANIDFSGHKSR